MNHLFQCRCGVRAEGEPEFVRLVYDAHLHCNDGVVSVDAGPVAAPEVENPIVRRTVIALSAPGSALRSRLNQAVGDLAAAGYSPQEIAARLEAGESVDV